MGYSLGGRLALHALIDSPQQWSEAIIISAHPGLAEGVRAKRREEDAIWAKRFLEEPWSDVLQAWNNREVFAHDKPVVRKEQNFSRSLLAQALTTWSLGNQKDLAEAIGKLPMPITWVVGEYDTKFVSEAMRLSFANPSSRVIIVPGAGHRIDFETVAKISSR